MKKVMKLLMILWWMICQNWMELEEKSEICAGGCGVGGTSSISKHNFGIKC